MGVINDAITKKGIEELVVLSSNTDKIVEDPLRESNPVKVSLKYKERSESPIKISLSEILGNKSIKYIENVLLPEFEKLVKESKLSGNILHNIYSTIKSHGILAILPPAEHLNVKTLNTSRGGYLAIAKLNLTDECHISHIIKKEADDKEYKKTLKNQKTLQKALEGTEFSEVIPKLDLYNNKDNLLVYAFAEGNLLGDLLVGKNDDQKEAILKKVVDSYANFITFLNSDDIKKKTKFPTIGKPLQELFNERYCGKVNSYLYNLISRDITDELDYVPTNDKIVHGDFHPKNIIVNGKVKFIDWPRAFSNGFYELDIGKMLSKSNIGFDLEEKIAKYAAEKLYPSQNEIDASIRRFKKNQILQDLLASVRYISRANSSTEKTEKEKYSNWGLVAFNNAITRAQIAYSEGLIRKETLDELKKDVPSGLRLLENYEELKNEFNPNLLASFESEPEKTLAEMFEFDPNIEISSIKKEVKKSRFKKIKKYAYLTIASIASLIAVERGTQFYRDYEQSIINEELLLQKQDDYALKYYNFWLEYSHERTMKNYVDGKIGSKVFLEDSNIDSIANKYKLRPELLRGMLRANRYYSDMDYSYKSDNQNARGIALLDPISLKGGPDENLNDPVFNLEYCSKRLSDLIKLFNGDEKKALMEFYNPFEKSRYGYDNSEKLLWKNGMNSITDRQLKFVRSHIRQIVYSALNGFGYANDGGIGSMIEKTPPQDF